MRHRLSVNVSIEQHLYLAYLLTPSSSACKIRYYPDYYTKDGLRFYYRDATGKFSVPDVVQIEEHMCIDSKLSERFTMQMLFAWYVFYDSISSPCLRCA